jgi:iron complex transport system permease protein
LGDPAITIVSQRFVLIAGLAVVAVLALISLFIGVSDVSLPALFIGDHEHRAMLVLLASRIPRTLSLILAGAAMATAGLLLQMLARNRFVEPSTVGTMESASLGLLVTLVLWPSAPVIVKMSIAALFALAGTALFLRILSLIKWRDVLIVPLVGLMLSGVIESVTDFFAYRFELLQALVNWRTGDFSGVLRGRYELLWLTFALALAAYAAADRFTVAGLGDAISTNLGLSYKRILAFGLTIVALISAVVVVSVGTIPFLGLIVPNVVRMAVGDNMRKGLPYVALLGSGMVLASDIAGRLIRFPYEIPIGTVMGVIGAILFLYLLLRRSSASV